MSMNSVPKNILSKQCFELECVVDHGKILQFVLHPYVEACALGMVICAQIKRKERNSFFFYYIRFFKYT